MPDAFTDRIGFNQHQLADHRRGMSRGGIHGSSPSLVDGDSTCAHTTDAPLDPRHPRPDELAERFENYEPEPGDERPVEEYLLERAALARARSERQIVDAITTARTKNVSWQRIGELLGTQRG